ncbi:MAG: hypothetical protein ACE5JV_01310 [Nitrososphaerales archaeon]
MPPVNADQFNVSMQITNDRYDTVKVVPLGSAYTFQHSIDVDVTDIQLYKIEKIFGQTEFVFNWSSHNVEAEHFPWNVSITAPIQPGNSLKVKFV